MSPSTFQKALSENIKQKIVYLQNSAHPLKAVFLSGVWSLLSHDHDPLIVQHRDGKHGYPAGNRGFKSAMTLLWILTRVCCHKPASVDKLHGLHSQRRGDDVVRVVTAPPHHH